MLLIHRDKGSHDPDDRGDVVLPQVREDKLQVDCALSGPQLGRPEGRGTVIGAVKHIEVEFVTVLPLHPGAVYHGTVTPADGVVMDKREMDYIELIFYDPGVVGMPGVGDLSVAHAGVQVVKERGLGRVGFFIPPPDPDKTLVLVDGVAYTLELLRHGGVFSIGGDEGDTSATVIAEAVKRTLYPILDELSLAQGGPPVGTLVGDAVQAGVVTP